MKTRLLFAVALFFLATGVAIAGSTGITLDQCANGPLSAPLACTGAQWQNGNINPQNSHYFENDSSPYRALLTGMTPGDVVSVTIQYAFTTSYLHTHDYLTSWDHTASGDPCSDQTCTFTTTLPIPPDPLLPLCPFDPNGPGVPQQPGVFEGHNITLTEAAYVGTHPCQGQALDTTMVVTFTVGSPNAVLAWGGHISQQLYWGVGQTASSLGGSPYHMRILDWTYKNVGNQDRSMQLAAAPTAVRLTAFEGIPDAPRSSALPIIVIGLLAGTAITILAVKR